MITLTEEQVKKKYGEQAIQAFPETPKQEGYLSRVKSSIAGNLSGVADSQKASMAGTMNPLAAGANIAKNITGAVLSPVAEAIRPVAEKTIAPVLGAITNKITNTKAVQDFTDLMSKYPELSGAIADTIETGLNVAAIEGTVGTIKGSANLVKTGVQKTTQTAQNAYESVKMNGIKYPKQISDKITLGKINEQTQTILKETPVEKFDRYVQSGIKAKQDPRMLTPLEEAGNTADTINRVIKEDLGNIGRQKSATLNSVKDTKVPNVAANQLEKVQTLLQQKLTSSERTLVNQYVKELKLLGKNPTAGSLDATVDKLQATLFEKASIGAIPVTTRVKAFINQSIRELNDGLKSMVDKTLGSNDYSVLNSSYSTKTKIFNALNKALGTSGNRGGSLFKSFFSPSGEGVKQLFALIKKEYGIDLAQDATLAKFVMETLGDTRARSLLQLPPTSATGIVGRGLEYIENKLTSPTKVFEKARTLSAPKQKL